ncbi:hypothetical protein [Methylobacterium segetis]|uniref:hypothetical protein n=1 Tax=Methylobacterium segetis TaxID=2488750 RepID=UPI0014054723|nr:hypothetical protein [Methylobacterium segetis]
MAVSLAYKTACADLMEHITGDQGSPQPFARLGVEEAPDLYEAFSLCSCDDWDPEAS